MTQFLLIAAIVMCSTCLVASKRTLADALSTVFDAGVVKITLDSSRNTVSGNLSNKTTISLIHKTYAYLSAAESDSAHADLFRRSSVESAIVALYHPNLIPTASIKAPLIGFGA